MNYNKFPYLKLIDDNSDYELSITESLCDYDYTLKIYNDNNNISIYYKIKRFIKLIFRIL